MGSNDTENFSTLLQEFKCMPVKQNEIFEVIHVVNAMKSYFEDYVTKFDKYQQKWAVLLQMEKKVDDHEPKINVLAKDKHKSLSNKIVGFQTRYNVFELYTYQSNIEINGIIVQNTENLYEIFNMIARKIGFECSVSDIKYIHRVQS